MSEQQRFAFEKRQTLLFDQFGKMSGRTMQLANRDDDV
jgi:hypothetical protein